MVKSKLIILIWIFGCCSFLSCEDVFDAQQIESGRQVVVVEGILTNEFKRHQIKLSNSFLNLGDQVEPVLDAIVTISDGTNIFVLSEQEEMGIYLTDSMSAVFDRNYVLDIEVNEKTYSAETNAALGPTMVPFHLEEVQTDLFEYIYNESGSPSMLELLVDWEEEDSLGVLRPLQSRLFFYTLNILEVNQIFAPNKERLLFPKGASVFRRQYSLTVKHQEFIRSFLSETEWRGGFFDVAPGNVVTNLSEGAVGYFAVSMVETDTSIVQ